MHISAAENVIGVKLVAIPDSRNSGSNGSGCSRISVRVTKRDDSQPDVSPSCGPFPHLRIVTVSFSLSHVGFLKNWFVVSTKFLADVTLLWRRRRVMRRSAGFALMDNNSPFVDFDGHVPRGRAVNLPDLALGGDWG